MCEGRLVELSLGSIASSSAQMQIGFETFAYFWHSDDFLICLRNNFLYSFLYFPSFF